MIERETGESAVEANIMTAIKVVREAHVATSSLLSLLDERFAKRGYIPAHPTSSKWVGLLMNGAQLGATANWMATVLHRGYLEASSPASSAIIIDVDLGPEKYREPVLSMLGLSFAAPVTASDFWKSWSWDAATGWHGGDLDRDLEAPQDALMALLRKRPARAAGRIIRLCQLDRQNTERLVVEPAIACVARARALGGTTSVQL